MVSIPFNPFDQDFDDLEAKDLLKLRDVAEGWYVEYKREVVNTKSIGKSLAAFANHYGGWIFYGIKGATDGSNVAEAFPGLGGQEVSTLIESLRNAAKDVVNPSPYYEHIVLNGPCSEIELIDNRAIVAVTVPSGPDAPYIHSDGRIYRRVADASDPKSETDRFTLDYLWQRRQKAHERLTSFLKQESLLSKGEEDLSFIDLFLLTDPLRASGQYSNLAFKRFTELMSDPHTPGISILYDNFYTMANGMIARQINSADPYNLVPTWRFYSTGFSHVSLPIPSTKIDAIHPGGWLRGYKHEEEFLSQVNRGHSTSGHLLDINQIIFTVVASVAQYKRLVAEAGIKGPVYAKAALHNIWRRIPFLDTEAFVNFIKKHGLPVLQFEKELAPPGSTLESLVHIEDRLPTNNVDAFVVQALDALPLVTSISNALGLPRLVTFTLEEEWWWSAAGRAPEVNRWRETMFKSGK